MQTKILLPQDIEVAVSILKNSGIVAFPTETVYGLGARLFDPAAIHKIFAVKGRPSDNPLIAHISDMAQVGQIVLNASRDFYTLAKAFWPGPLTIVMTKHPAIPNIATSSLDSIGIRMPKHALARELISKVGEPLVAPSANLSGKPSPTQAAHVLEDFAGIIPAILDGGRSEMGIESTVISLVHKDPVILRPGRITQAQIEKALGKQVLVENHQEKPTCPGMKYRHYAPKAKVSLFFSALELTNALPQDRASVLILGSPGCDFEGFENFHACSQFDLYTALRYADTKSYEQIFIYCDEFMKDDPALMNRMSKAAFS